MNMQAVDRELDEALTRADASLALAREIEAALERPWRRNCV
jgi:hypothetical protein